MPPFPGSTHGTVSNNRQDVRAIVSKLEHNTTDTQTLVSEIHRTVVKGQANDSRNVVVSDTCTLPTTEYPFTVA